jgi:mono/diheme cytochrome c family protein
MEGGDDMKRTVIPIVLFAMAAPALSLADGRSDYKAECAGCHGMDMVSTRKAQAMKVDVKKLVLTMSKKNKSEMVAIIEKGTDKMPAFEKELSKEQISDIVDYIFALSK